MQQNTGTLHPPFQLSHLGISFVQMSLFALYSKATSALKPDAKQNAGLGPQNTRAGKKFLTCTVSFFQSTKYQNATVLRLPPIRV